MTDMMQTNKAHHSKWLILPGSMFRLFWDLVCVIAVLYYIMAIPLRIMFQASCNKGLLLMDTGTVIDCLSRWNWSLIFDYAFDVLFLLDLPLRSVFFAFRHYVGEAEVIATDPDVIWAAYTSSVRFFITLVVCLPLDFIALGTGGLLCYRLSKLPTVFLLPILIGDVQSFLDKEKKWIISSESVTIIHLAIGTIVMVIWISVVWSLVHFLVEDQSVWVSSFYWCLTTVTTVGYGDILASTTNQTIYVIFISFIGPSFCATIIANVASYVHRYDFLNF